jgi:hypothetical protein
MQNGKILLVNLNESQSDLFIGSLICAKFQQATFGRRYIPESQRVPYYLYIDECNTILKYAAKEFEAILLRARKYKLCLTLTNQIPEDLPPEIQRKLGTIGSLILFNLDSNNARFFKDRIRPFEIEDLIDLPKFHAICRTDNQVFPLTTPTFLGPSPASYAQIIRNRIVDKPPLRTASEDLQLPHVPAQEKSDPEPLKSEPNIPPVNQGTKRNPKASR